MLYNVNLLVTPQQTGKQKQIQNTFLYKCIICEILKVKQTETSTFSVVMAAFGNVRDSRVCKPLMKRFYLLVNSCSVVSVDLLHQIPFINKLFYSLLSRDTGAHTNQACCVMKALFLVLYDMKCCINAWELLPKQPVSRVSCGT